MFCQETLAQRFFIFHVKHKITTVYQSVFAIETNRCISKKTTKTRINTLTAELFESTEIMQNSRNPPPRCTGLGTWIGLLRFDPGGMVALNGNAAPCIVRDNALFTAELCSLSECGLGIIRCACKGISGQHQSCRRTTQEGSHVGLVGNA